MSALYLQLGRTGDILAILPLLYADHQRTGQKSKLMAAKEFAPVLDGCSYIDPVIFDGSWLDLDGAVALAKTLSDDVIVTSIHGQGSELKPDANGNRFVGAVEKHAFSQSKVHPKGRSCSSFQKEAWALAGRLGEWDDNLPLVFDMRSPEREKRLLDASGFKRTNKKPVMLLAINGGVTAPFPYADLLRDYVTAKFGNQYRIIDLPMVEQPNGRIYDLLAVMEQSDLLIASDSMPLHLVWAVRDLPVFALTNDRDPQGNPSLWHGSPWRPNHLWYCRYHDWPARAVEMMEYLELPQFSGMKPIDGVMAWREDLFSAANDNSSLPISKGMCSRELNGSPFVRDAVRMAMQRVPRAESMVTLKREMVDVAGVEIHFGEVVYAYRMSAGQFSPICDLFSAPKSFWRQILPEIPDLVLDNEEIYWSEALCMIFRKHGAKDATGCAEFVGGEK